MRRVSQAEFVRRAVQRATEQFPSFQRIFEEGILWQLQRSPLVEAVEIQGSNPRLFILETNAWRHEGIPALTLGYHVVADGIEIVRLALHTNPASESRKG